MISLRRWWGRYGSQLILVGLLLLTAGIIRQTQAVPIYELYYWLTRPIEMAQANQQRELTNARIQELEQQVEELQQQNQRLKELSGYLENHSTPLKTAPIIGRSADHWWEQMAIGLGKNEGIHQGDIVTGLGGLVGRVEQVTPHSSLVLLISDPKSRVGAIISRSRDMGFIRGEGEQQVVMRFFEKVPDVKVGDSVLTSPASRLFPPGIPVGKVTALNLDQAPAPEATITLNVPMEELEWVFVQPKTNHE
ncbi:MAG: rod shape-determining protein MreC [Cyanobacteria bacterium]|jgi:rod shape-determining protein MreC|nr:rod shape-determining protein MreC [Cyanobacteria bacterium GSL.Bin1]